MLVILISGVVLGALLNGAQTGDSQFGAGLKALFESTESVTDAEDKAIVELIKNKSTEKEFDFYTLLPDIEQIMPDDLPNATPARANNDLDYYLQAASFRSHADAERLRARLAPTLPATPAALPVRRDTLTSTQIQPRRALHVPMDCTRLTVPPRVESSTATSMVRSWPAAATPSLDGRHTTPSSPQSPNTMGART